MRRTKEVRVIPAEMPERVEDRLEARRIAVVPLGIVIGVEPGRGDDQVAAEGDELPEDADFVTDPAGGVAGTEIDAKIVRPPPEAIAVDEGPVYGDAFAQRADVGRAYDRPFFRMIPVGLRILEQVLLVGWDGDLDTARRQDGVALTLLPVMVCVKHPVYASKRRSPRDGSGRGPTRSRSTHRAPGDEGCRRCRYPGRRRGSGEAGESRSRTWR
jgi:hypothetical protein